MDGTDLLHAQRIALGRELAEFRNREGLRQEDLAKRIHFARSTIANVETGRSGADATFWQRCDDALHADGALVGAHAASAPDTGSDAATDGPLPADDGFDVPWDQPGLLHVLEDWPDSMNRRSFLTVSGLALTQTGWLALDTPAPALSAAAEAGTRVTPPLVDLVEEIVHRAQQLDDQQGSAGASFVADQFTNVSRLLRRGTYDPGGGRRLVAAAAQLAQTAGFMSYDAGDDPRAQRWYLTGLRAAHAAADRGLTASILGLMSNHAIDLHQAADATQLGAAAIEAASGAAPRVRALLTARAGLAHAATGDLTGFRRAREQTLALCDRGRLAGEPGPRWAAYATAVELDAIAGRGLVMMADQIPARSPALLAEAEPLLRGRAHTSTEELPQRSALRHGAWLALAHTRAGDLEQAVAAGGRALDRIPAVSSARSVALLDELRTELTTHARRSRPVAALVARLEHHLPDQADKGVE